MHLLSDSAVLQFQPGNQLIFPVSYGQKAYEMIMPLDLETVLIGIKLKAMLQGIATEASLFDMNQHEKEYCCPEYRDLVVINQIHNNFYWKGQKNTQV